MEIKCEFVVVGWEQETKLYTCKVSTAEIKSSMHEIKKFTGYHEKGRSNKDITAIWFESTVVECFPRNLQQHFPNLALLKIENCGLKRIAKHNLKGLEGLTIFCISRCKLRYLPDNLLEGMTKLRKISFRDNEIEFASSKLLQPLFGRQNLSLVYFRGNKNIDAIYEPGNRSSVPTLRTLMNLIDRQCKKPAQQTIVSRVSNFKDFDRKIADLWTSGRFSDLSIVVRARKFKVHKSILGMQNAKFAKIIEDHREATEIKIDEFAADAVEALLHFIYTGEIYNEENAKEKFLIADKFEVVEMRSPYEEILFDQLNKLNALDIFLAAHATSSKFLKENAFAVISEMFPQKLPDALVEHPEKVKRLVEYRRGIEAILKD